MSIDRGTKATPLRKLLDYDPITGIGSTYEYDAGTDQIRITPWQYLDALKEQNKREYSDCDTTRRQGDGFGRKVASIPMVVYQDLWSKGIARDQKAFKRWLSDSDNRVFRTSPDRL